MEIRPLQHELQEKAILELNEDPGRIQEAFDHIREWLRKQPHLNIRKDDQTMIAFFRGCKWNLQIVKQKLDYFYSFKSLTPEFFVGIDPLSPNIQKVLKAKMIFPLPMVKNYFGPVIVMYIAKNMDINETPLVEILKVFFMTLDILLREDDRFVVSGLTFLADHDQCPVSYFLQCTPTIMKNCVKSIQNAYPVRTKNMIFFNSLTLFETIFNTLAKPFLNAKMSERIQVLNTQNSKKFLSEFPKKLLPKEYGGTNGSVKDLRTPPLHYGGIKQSLLFQWLLCQTPPPEKAIAELNEDPRRIQEAFDHIREWLRKQPHLNVRKDDQTMIAFFRGCKWNLQIVKQKLDYFYSFKSHTPEFFRDIDPLSPEIQKVLKAGLIFPLPMVKNYIGPVIVMYNLTNVDVNETPFVENAKVFFMTLDLLLKENDDFVVSGLTFLVDHDQCPFSYFLQCTPTLMKNCVKGIQNAYPVRTKNMVFFNSLTVFETICNTLIKPFMNAKIRQRVLVSPHVVLEKWKDKIESYREWFIEGGKYVTNEKLRIDKTMLFEHDIGVDGTFRNLLID
ncbi:hypothetical protein RI129_012865 [Pyrocoelia pectoralis]|uniref:CRAL-TRIO domain-containing protein n=1 Tax=Pyrocoelia pectoralis TaxID=417401 RepID=A0AAN7Z6W2_9COLE